MWTEMMLRRDVVVRMRNARSNSSNNILMMQNTIWRWDDVNDDIYRDMFDTSYTRRFKRIDLGRHNIHI